MSLSETVYKICLGFAMNPWDAQDLTQDVYLKAFRNLDSLKDNKYARDWLFRIARNTALDHGRKHRVRQIFLAQSRGEPAETRPPEYQLDHAESLRSLKKAVRQLPKKLRDVFILREYGDLSYREIAEILGIKDGTVMSRLLRAREAVRMQMMEKEYEKK